MLPGPQERDSDADDTAWMDAETDSYGVPSLDAEDAVLEEVDSVAEPA